MEISKKHAELIASSQKDLGNIGQENMVIALCESDDSNEPSALDAFDELDSLSQYIVSTIVCADELESLLGSLAYARECLKSLQTAIENILEEKYK